MKKIWKRLFSALALMFMFFTLAILLANTTLLKTFFIWYEKGIMSANAQLVANVDLDDRDAAAQKLEAIETMSNTKIAIYQDDVLIYFTTNRRAGSFGGKNGFDVDVFDNVILPDKNSVYNVEYDEKGGMFAMSQTKDNTVILYTVTKDDIQVLIFMEMSLIKNSAFVAGLFCIIIVGLCLLVSLIWAVYYARRFSKPISRMNEIAVNMTNLDFSQKVEVKSKDEIGQLAESINNLSDSLCSAMNELTEKNEKLQDEIDRERKLDSMRKRFVANVSHELKTPISIIQGYAEGLKDGMAMDDASREKYVSVILDESKRMYELVISLLNLSKVEGGFKVNEEKLDLNACVLNAVDVLSSNIEQKEINLSIDIPENRFVKGDVILIEQAVRNYLSNAISHTIQKGNIKIYCEPYNDNIRLCVYNSDSFIEGEEMENLFEPFDRVDKSHNRNEGRFGLGLSIVKAICTAHNCDFGVFTNDTGTTFWLELKTAD